MIIKEITSTAARRYSQRDHRLGVIPLPEVVYLFISIQKNGRMVEIGFRFPGIFRRGISLPCSQVQSLAVGTLVREDGLDFVFFLVINDIRRWQREGGTI